MIFQNFLFSKEFPACNVCFGFFSKIKKGSGITFGAHFLHDFFIKMFVFNTLTMDKVSVSHLISFSRYQTKRVIKGTLMQI